ncbi:hypothetical protein DXG01_005727 [Tephrocybe rancida]|nr:hypothetical protein DXG01_005727 [Tephrocybe rancida]
MSKEPLPKARGSTAGILDETLNSRRREGELPAQFPQKKQKTQAPAVAPVLAPAQITAPVSVEMPVKGSCLFPTYLPFLQDALVPNPKTKVKDYAALFTAIQRDPPANRTGQCFVTFPSGTSNRYESFKGFDEGFLEPMDGDAYEIGIARLRHNKGERAEARSPLWAGGAPGEAIYEVAASFDVRYSYPKEPETSVELNSWAVRSREDLTMDGDGRAYLANYVDSDEEKSDSDEDSDEKGSLEDESNSDYK